MRHIITPVLAVSALAAAVIAPRLVVAFQAPAPPTPPIAVAPVATATPVETTAPVNPNQPNLSVRLDRTTAMAGGTVRAELLLTAPTLDVVGQALPTDVVLVIDRSGSMSGAKMNDAKEAANELLGLLGPNDRVSVVSFSDNARVDVPLGRVDWNSYGAVNALASGGGTQMQLGLGQALNLVAEPTQGRARRVILLSDGKPNHRQGLDELAQRAAQLETPLTTVGIGADYDVQLMQSLADQGTGNFYWANADMPLATVFADEFSASRAAVTASTQLSWTGAGGVTVADWGGLPAQGDTVQLGQLFSGQTRSLWVTLQLAPGVDAESLDLGGMKLSYTEIRGGQGQQVAALGQVGVTHDAVVAARGLDANGWASSLVEDEYNGLLSKVSNALSQGKKQEALQEIELYRLDNGQLNETVQSDAVYRNLAEVEQLQQQVDQDQVGKLGLLDLASKAYRGRRKGQSYGSMPAPRPH